MTKFLKRAVLNNFRFKVVALTLACATWYFIHGEETLEVNRRLTVNILLPNGLMVRDGATRTKYVTIRGPRAAMGPAIASANITADINLPKATKGTVRYQLTRANLVGEWDKRVSVRIIDPLLDLEIDERFERMLELKEVLQGSPATGFSVEKVTVEPAYVKVSGIKSVISKLDKVFTETKDISDISESKVLDASIIPPAGVDPSNISSLNAKIKIQVGESKVNKKFLSIPVEVTGTSLRTTAKPAAVDIEIQGAAGVIGFVKVEDLSAFVDARDLQPGSHEKKIQVKIPSDTVLIETNPENVVLQIRAASRTPAPTRTQN